MNIEEVLSTTHRISPRERVPFHCTCCGECCRHVRQSVPLESPDVFRLTRLLREKDKGIICMDDFIARYTELALESFGIPIHDNDFIAWQKALFSVRQQIVELEKMLPDKSMERVWSITYQALYLNYDIQEDFRKQFQKNSDRLIDALEHLPALWKELRHE